MKGSEKILNGFKSITKNIKLERGALIVSTKRIDIMITNDGKLHVKGWAQGYIMIKLLEENKFLAVTSSWKIIIDKDSISIAHRKR